jgi:D-alanyl-D-alanine carboxypeptidase
VHSTRALILLLVALALAAPVVASPAESVRTLVLSADCVLLLDPDGKTVYAKNPEFEHAPASLVKLMTLYLAYEDLEAGRADLDDIATVSRNAATVGRYRMGLRMGERVPVRVLLEGVAIASANDAAEALAEHLGGTEAEFVTRMNATARLMGLTSTRYTNPHGLPDPRQRSSARDLAVLITRLLQDYPASRTMLGGQTFAWNGRVHTRHIPLFQDPGGVQALKTGFTNEAGYNLAVSAWRAGQQFIMIVLGARSRAMSYADGKKLLRYGFVEAGLETASVERPRPIHRRTVKVVRAVRARRVAAR